MNEYDSARMGDLLKESHGMEQTQNAEEADVPARENTMLGRFETQRRKPRG